MPEGIDISETSLGSGSPSLSKVAGMAMKHYDELGKETEGDKALKADIGELRTSLKNRKMPEPPPEVELPKPPEQRQTSAMEAFGSFASLLGVFGGFFTKTPLVTSLEASTAAMNAIHKNDSDTYKAAMDQWKTQTDYALKVGDYQLKRYKDILENDKTSVDEKINLIRMEASAVQNEHIAKAAQTNDLNAIERSVHDLMSIQQRAQENIDKMSVADQEYRKWANSPEGQAANPQQKLAKHGEFMMADPETKAKVEKEEAEAEKARKVTGNPQQVALARFLEENPGATSDQIAKFNQKNRSQPRSATAMATQKYIEENPNATADDIAKFGIQSQARAKADAASLTKLVTQKNAIEAFENTAIKNGDILVKLGKQVDQTGVPVAERWIRSGRQATGDPLVAKFHAQMYLYRSEVAKILTNPNLVGVLSDSARNEMKEVLPNPSSAAQIYGVHELLKGDFARRKDSIEEQVAKIETDLGHPTTYTPTAPDISTATDSAPPVQIKTDAEYNALQPNTEFIGPDGKRRRKP